MKLFGAAFSEDREIFSLSRRERAGVRGI